MTKEQYMNYKLSDNMAILYQYYKEKFDRQKHKPFLKRVEFDTFAHMCLNIGSVYENVCKYFDNKLNITELKDKDGKILFIY